MDAAEPPNDGAVHRVYPQGKRVGPNEVIMRQLEVTHIPDTPPKGYKLTVTDGKGALPLAGEETYVMDYEVKKGDVQPSLEAKYTVVFARPKFTADEQTPYTSLDVFLYHDKELP